MAGPFIRLDRFHRLEAAVADRLVSFYHTPRAGKRRRIRISTYCQRPRPAAEAQKRVPGLRASADQSEDNPTLWKQKSGAGGPAAGRELRFRVKPGVRRQLETAARG